MENLKQRDILGSSVVLRLNARQICDLEMLLCGAFAPLKGFMTEVDYLSCVRSMRLASGTFWSMPICLDAEEDFALSLKKGDEVVLQDGENAPLAKMRIEDIFKPDLNYEAEEVLGTSDTRHPGVRYLLKQSKKFYLGGPVELIEMPRHFDFVKLRRTPAEVRAEAARLGWSQYVGFQTRNPMHRAHVELIKRSMKDHGLSVLVNPVVGLTKPGDIDHYTRVKCYRHVMTEFPEGKAMLSLLNLAMRMGGPREALWHASIRKNFGCSHFIVGRDHAGPGKDAAGKPFYEPDAARELAIKHQKDIGVQILPFEEMFYVESRKSFFMSKEVPEGEKLLSVSGTQVRNALDQGQSLPHWFSYPKVVEELRLGRSPKPQQGLVLFFTGLSGAGKSTLAKALEAKILEGSARRVTMLDGDEVRSFLSSELGFSKEHRDLNIRRIGYVAAQVARAKGVAICAPIAPYAATRSFVRSLVETEGANFIEIYVSTELEVCEKRERKGLYAKARAGLIPSFTGVNDPYEKPESPELALDTALKSVEQCLELVWSYLKKEGYFV